MGNANLLPDSVLGMVEARLDALGDELKQVVRAGTCEAVATARARIFDGLTLVQLVHSTRALEVRDGRSNPGSAVRGSGSARSRAG